jgi:predicted nucleic acid-binding protein
VYLLDTDICIELLRSNSRVVSNIEKLPEDTKVYTSIINASELLYGAYLSDKKEQRIVEVKNFLSDIEVLGIDLRSAEIYGELKSVLKQKGNLIADNDLFIASVAKRNELTLITHNIKHFEKISGLKIEDWM